MIYEIKSNSYSAKIDSLGAQLIEFKCLSCGKNMLWSADKDVWGKVSPVLFPVIGALKNNGEYTVNGKPFKLTRHGFCRDMEWSVNQISSSEIQFIFTSTPATLLLYPFDYTLSLNFFIKGSELKVKFNVTNDSKTDMFYAYGAHPGFCTEDLNNPENKTGVLNECSLIFEKPFECTTLRQSSFSGLVKKEKFRLFSGDTLNLNSALFDDDALILTGLPTNAVTLKRPAYPDVKLQFDTMPTLGVWAMRGTRRYICIEPWTNTPEIEGTDMELSKKPNLITLKSGKTDEHTYSIKVL